MDLTRFSIVSLVVSTITFFIARHYANRYFDDSGLPKGTTRSILVFAIALAVSYGVGAAIDWVAA